MEANNQELVNAMKPAPSHADTQAPLPPKRYKRHPFRGAMFLMAAVAIANTTPTERFREGAD
jgi:hypothetical protein